MSSRREELEIKRQRLQELRRQREEKQKEQREKSQNQINAASNTSQGAKEDDINSIVGKLVGERSPSSIPASSESSKSEGNLNGAQLKKSAVYKSISIQTNEIQEVKKPERITYNKSVQTLQLTQESENEDRSEIRQDGIKEENVLEKQDELLLKDTKKEDQVEVEVEVEAVADVDESLLTSFFNRSFKIINRVMDEEEDILRSYKDSKQTSETVSSNYLEILSLKFENGIYSIDSSRFFPELLLISSGKNIWIYNKKFKKFEYNFKTSTDILNAQFSDFKSNIIYGSGYNGKLFSWNLDSDSKLPYLVSSSNSMNHSYPVFALNQTNENGGTLISASTDGRICTWTSQMLSKPISPPIDLKSPKSLSLRFDELSPTSVINLPNDHGFLIVGCEDGNIYRVKRFDNKIASNPDSRYDKIYQKHKGPITSLEHSIEFPNLFVSSSFDWTVSLWNVNQPESPLLTIYRNNAIPQVKWRNGYSTQLGIIYGNVFELMDLSVDWVSPIVTIDLGKLLNKFSFDKNGSSVSFGFVDGDFKIYDLLVNDQPTDLKTFKRLHLA